MEALEDDNGCGSTASTVESNAAAAGAARTGEVPRPLGKAKGIARRKSQRAALVDARPSPSGSSSASSAPSRQQRPGGGVYVRSRRRPPQQSHGGDDLQDLSLPLGMSFAAVIAQVLDWKNVAGEKIPVDHLSMICTSAVKEAVSNVYGNRFDCFIKNFERSFGSTLKTLRVINAESVSEQGNSSCTSYLSNCFEGASTQGTLELLAAAEDIQDSYQDSYPLNSVNNQLILHPEVNQQLAHVSQSIASSGYKQAVLNTWQKSVMEHSRSNDLKEVELGFTKEGLQLKQLQLNLYSDSNIMERVKIRMGISKASFKEEKLKNQMQDTRHAELLKRCIDLLVAGLILMSGFLIYGASIYSYKRITEATASCTPEKSNSWWVPKPVASLSSGLLVLRCHVVVLTRMTFGLLMILAVTYSVFQRSAGSGSTMPVTFILLLLGGVCGAAGKFCVDTLGGNGYCWLLYWEVLCLLHFFANAFPSVLYHILHGPISVSQEAQRVMVPYWLRQYAFYTVLVLILPTLSGLKPFASLWDWKEHFSRFLGGEMGD